MDFRQLGSAPVSKPEPAPAGAPAPQHTQKKRPFSTGTPKWLSVLYVVILFGIAALLVLVAISLARGTNSNGEQKLVDTSKYQAVFLNNGQVYFGNITTINNDYLKLNNIFYLTQSSDTTTANSNSNYTLVKLGCQQIHYPYDQMVINRSQVTFWENLSADGKVAQSIAQFKKQNPNGPDCTQSTSQTPTTNTPSQSSNNAASQTGNKQ